MCNQRTKIPKPSFNFQNFVQISGQFDIWYVKLIYQMKVNIEDKYRVPGLERGSAGY